MEHMHQWKKQARGTVKRASIGLTASLSFTLIAFEWTTFGPRAIHDPTGPIELPWEQMPIIVVHPEPGKKKAAPVVKKKTASGPIKIADEPVAPDPLPANDDPIEDPTTELNTAVDTATATPITMTMPILDPGILPYFQNCDRVDRKRTKECTEDRILRHLDRHLRIPRDLKGSVRTTVTFEIDAQGSIGRIHCAPKVDPSIGREIERVIRSLPEFVPGSQGGHPVAVYYQIPLLLTRN